MVGVNIDTSAIADLANIDDAMKDVANEAARSLAKMIHAKAVDLAGQKLRSRRGMFIDGLKVFEGGEDVWVVSLDAKVRWIDDGQPRHSMLDALLASPKAKRAKDGSRYIVVPFDHSPGQGATTTTTAQQDLISTIKGAMRKEGIPFGKIETNNAGAAKIGKLHSFTIGDKPIKTKNGPGQGHGAIGDVRQGATGIPFLQGVNVYQQKDAKAKSGAKKVIMTFRIASSKHESQQRWINPGNEAMNIMDDAAKWALDTWDNEIAPGIVSQVMLSIS